MCYEWRGNSLIVVHNFDERAHEIRIRQEVPGGEKPLNLLLEDQSRADAGGRHRIALEAHGYRWYRVGNFSHVLRRRKE
jgi:maltose alpha-D-glucosyltransferase/alpha-amylase